MHNEREMHERQTDRQMIDSEGKSDRHYKNRKIILKKK